MPGTDITDAELKCVVAEIAAMTRPPTLRPGEVTAAMVAEAEGILPRKASYRLEREWVKRRLRKRRVQEGSHRPWAYSKPHDTGDGPDPDGLRYAPYPKRG